MKWVKGTYGDPPYCFENGVNTEAGMFSPGTYAFQGNIDVCDTDLHYDPVLDVAYVEARRDRNSDYVVRKATSHETERIRALYVAWTLANFVPAEWEI